MRFRYLKKQWLPKMYVKKNADLKTTILFEII